MKGVLDVHQELLARGVPHEVLRVRGQVVTSADELPKALDVPARDCVAVRCYVTEHGLAAVVVPAGVVPHPTAVLDALGARSLRPATPDEINAATDYAAGLVCPVGLPKHLPLLLDSTLVGASRVVYCPVGEGGVVLGIRAPHLLLAIRPEVARLSAVPALPDVPAAGAAPGAPAAPDAPGQEIAVWQGGARVIDLDAPRQARPRQRRTAS